MEKISTTKLRTNIYAILDEIIRSGEPLAIKRHGKTLLISLDKPNKSKLKRLKPHHTILGSADELINLEVSQWTPNDHL